MKTLNAKHEFLPDAARPLFFAHRGYSSKAPENTFAAFHEAKRQGIPGIELDVRLTADERVVVFHDDSLQRLANDPRKINQCTWAELKNVDVGSWFSDEFSGQRIPLLSEVLEWAGNHIYIDIELKDFGLFSGILEEKVADLVYRHNMQKKVFVSSFNPVALRRMSALCADLPCALIYPGNAFFAPVSKTAFWRKLAGNPVMMKPQMNCFDTTGFGSRNIMRQIPWTVNDPATAIELIESGAEGIISDDPAAVLNALSDYRAAIAV